MKTKDVISFRSIDDDKERLNEETRSFYAVPIKILVNGVVVKDVYAIFIRITKDNGNDISSKFFCLKSTWDDATSNYDVKTKFVRDSLVKQFGRKTGEETYRRLVNISKQVAKTL